MAMPWQLREGLKKRVKGALPRPIVEKCPSISANDLNIPSLNDPQTYTLPNISLKYSWLAAVRLNHAIIELTLRSAHRATLGRTQKFKIKHIRTGLGKAGSHGIRHAFICDCGEPVIKLYCLNHHIACRYCHRLLYASQACNQQQRPILQQARLKSFLAKPRLLHKARERLTKRFGEQAMLAQHKYGTRASSLFD